MPVLLALGYVALQGVITGHMAKDTKLGFWGGFAYGSAAGGLSMGLSAIPGASTGIFIQDLTLSLLHSSFTGMVTFGFDAIINNSAFNWKGWSLNVAMSVTKTAFGYASAVLRSGNIYHTLDNTTSFEEETKDLTMTESLALITAYNGGNTETTLKVRLENQVLNEETTGCMITSKLERININRARYGLSKSGYILDWKKKIVVGGFYFKSKITISPFIINHGTHAELEGILLHEYVHHIQYTGKWASDITHIMGKDYIISQADKETGAYYISYLHSTMSGLNNASDYLSASQSWADKSKAPFLNPADYDPIIRRLTRYKRF
jgi:hypothetical protein